MKNTIRNDTTERHRQKYENPGLMHQLVLGRFLDTLARELKPFENARALDFGCGEAFFWGQMENRGVEMTRLTGIDLREDALEEARRSFPQHQFLRQDLLTWSPEQRFDLVVASQVLEHLPDPAVFLCRLLDLTSPNGTLLLTVPREPFFMLSNLARGRDIKRFGNHPEHINLWGMRGFRKFVASHAQVQTVRAVFPFTIILAKP
jgi:2-polyprenyl-3-methyl-5-hydroxy-6-metoxy-1,4-benzoquinol methylase